MAFDIKDVLTKPHPLYEKRKEQWERDERRYKGGSHVIKDLIPFQWEDGTLTLPESEEAALAVIAQQIAGGDTRNHFDQRAESATYVNFGRRMTKKFVGRLAADAPKPGEGYDFGSLGTVRDIKDLEPPHTRAEHLYYNCDLQGSPLVSWMNEVQRQSMNTGHRWVGVTSPPDVSKSPLDWERGIRPYFTHFSPLAVPNWEFGLKGLDFLVISISMREMTGEDGSYSGKYVDGKLLYVRATYAGLGETYNTPTGGWWKFKADGTALMEGGEHVRGTLKQTSGVIPYCALIYEQDLAELSRSGTTELNNISASYMNISSAGDNDAIEAGGRTIYLLGVSNAANNLAATKKKEGSRQIPVPADDEGNIPQVYDTGATSASEAIETSLKRKREEAAIIAQDELRRSPDASGVARQIEFLEVENPQLALMAYNREATENQLLGWGCALFRVPADARVSWPKTFDLETDVEDWEKLFEVAGKAGIRSKTLYKRGLRGIAKEKGLPIEDNDWTAIDAEIDEEADRQAQEADVDDVDVFK